MYHWETMFDYMTSKENQNCVWTRERNGEKKVVFSSFQHVSLSVAVPFHNNTYDSSNHRTLNALKFILHHEFEDEQHLLCILSSKNKQKTESFSVCSPTIWTLNMHTQFQVTNNSGNHTKPNYYTWTTKCGNWSNTCNICGDGSHTMWG